MRVLNLTELTLSGNLQLSEAVEQRMNWSQFAGPVLVSASSRDTGTALPRRHYSVAGHQSWGQPGQLELGPRETRTFRVEWAQ